MRGSLIRGVPLVVRDTIHVATYVGRHRKQEVVKTSRSLCLIMVLCLLVIWTDLSYQFGMVQS